MTTKQLIEKLPLKGMVALDKNDKGFKITYESEAMAKRCFDKLLDLGVIAQDWRVQKAGVLIEVERL